MCISFAVIFKLDCSRSKKFSVLKRASQVNMKQSKQNATGARLNEVLRDESAKISLPATFQAPFDPRIVLGKLAVDKSKIMDSKKRPIWLEFANGAGAQNETDDTIK